MKLQRQKQVKSHRASEEFASCSKRVGKLLKGFLINVIIITIVMFTYFVSGTMVDILHNHAANIY